MSKPKEIPVEEKNYFAWPYEEQTKVKHKVLAYYWRIWVTKLGKYKDTMFVDCHGGCGAYIDEASGEVAFGSSIIVDQIATEINNKREHTNYVCICEKNSHYMSNLKSVWKDQNCSKNGGFMEKDFNEVLFMDSIRRYYFVHPTFFFIDPFGYDLKMENMKQLMKANGSEIIINFMYDHMNRFLSMEGLDQQRDEFFGSHDWINALTMQGEQRDKYLVGLYKNSLKRTTGAKFVFPYRLCFPGSRRTYYYLIHATNNIQGIVFMKDSFSSVNCGKMEYLGRYQNEYTLFDLKSYRIAEIASAVLNPFGGRTISFNSLLETIIEDVPFTRNELADAILLLEKEGKASVRRITSKRGRYREQDEISFGEIR